MQEMDHVGRRRMQRREQLAGSVQRMQQSRFKGGPFRFYSDSVARLRASSEASEYEVR